MADADAVRGAGLPDRLTSEPPSGPGLPSAQPDKVMTLVDHLTELRSRLVRSILAVVVGSAIGFSQAKPIRDLLITPLPNDHEFLQVLSPGDGFAIALKI